MTRNIISVPRTRKDVAPKLVPAILLANAQSLTNKMGELETVLAKENIGVSVITETWAHEEKLSL